jgi:hypothetical protein
MRDDCHVSALVTRLAIDCLRSARAKRESYVGQWLPELVVGDGGDPLSDSERAESISMAFLLLLQRLSPVERAVFLLHDVFGYGFGEIAPIVGKSADHCRQLALRARKHIESERPRFQPSVEVKNELASGYRGRRRAHPAFRHQPRQAAPPRPPRRYPSLAPAVTPEARPVCPCFRRRRAALTAMGSRCEGEPWR